MEEVILDVKGLKTFFYTYDGVAKAVDGVSYQLRAGEPLGIVGESGCGKSVSALSILRLIPDPPGRIGSFRRDREDLELLAAASVHGSRPLRRG